MSFQISRKTTSSATIEWIVPNLIVRDDINLIDGRKSSGKSSVIAAILGDWNNNEDLPKDKKLRNILWLSSEEPFDSTIKPRLMQYGLSEIQITTIDYRNGTCRKPHLPDDLSALCEFIDEEYIDALVIDPFSELKPADWSINDSDQMRAYMTAITALCSRTKTTAFLPRHMRKSQGTFSGDDGMGSVQIKASIRHPLRIDVTEEKVKRRYISVQESNIAPPSLPLQFEFEQQAGHFGKLKWLGHADMSIDEIKKLSESKVKRMKFDDAKSLLLEALAEGPCKATHLIEEAKNNGIGDRTLDDAKAELGVRSYRVKAADEKVGHWMWKLPDHSLPILLPGIGETDMQLDLFDLPEAKKAPEPLQSDTTRYCDACGGISPLGPICGYCQAQEDNVMRSETAEFKQRRASKPGKASKPAKAKKPGKASKPAKAKK